MLIIYYLHLKPLIYLNGQYFAGNAKQINFSKNKILADSSVSTNFQLFILIYLIRSIKNPIHQQSHSDCSTPR